MKDGMKIITMLSVCTMIMFLTACSATHKIKLGKKCTPEHQEWSYVWFIEKGSEDNVSKANCT